jgi:hypothetical protein
MNGQQLRARRIVKVGLVFNGHAVHHKARLIEERVLQFGAQFGLRHQSCVTHGAIATWARETQGVDVLRSVAFVMYVRYNGRTLCWSARRRRA